ncbi:hypothetical protein CC2G_013318 [Coprinopsis cinerea AmutBmut pab1-1]|nr:hypothetical protein CC2G_013318 [Coprinopsis cinerea AmutBmut pab1-1]
MRETRPFKEFGGSKTTWGRVCQAAYYDADADRERRKTSQLWFNEVSLGLIALKHCGEGRSSQGVAVFDDCHERPWLAKNIQNFRTKRLDDLDNG